MKRALTLLTVAFFSGSLPASEPAVDTINYGDPHLYLEIAPSLGNADEMRKLAERLKGLSDRATLRKILDWMHEKLEYKPEEAYEWRNYDEVIAKGCYGGCADQSIVCSVLLKAAGIPTVWVKTMDVEWIWNFKKKRLFDSWSGHVFLEVHLDGEWMLLDPGAKMLYGDYSPQARILPGNRFAYHKGNNPKQMIMSLQWEEWKQQTRAYFEQLDTSALPVDTAGRISIVPEVYIIGNSPTYQTLGEMVRDRGWNLRKSFNCNYEKLLPLAKGHILLVETRRGVPIVPLDVLDQTFPNASSGLQTTNGVVEIEGTTIMFIDLQDLLNALAD